MKYIDICIALYDYQSQSKEELSFQEHDILYILDKSDADWYKAQLKVPSVDGPTGLIPANYLEKAKPLGTVTAVYDYASQSSEELSFKENEVLTLYEKDDADWFVVENSKGDFGLAPSNYVQEDIITVKNTIATKPANPAIEPKWAIALFSFQPQSKDETFLDDNEQVLVTDYMTKDWWTIEHKDGKSGIVPANYLKFQDEYEAELKAEQEREQERLQAQKEQELKQLEQKRLKDLADRKSHREQQDKEKERQVEVERRRRMQEEAKQKEIESKRQASFAAANVIPSPQLGSPRRSQIPAPPPPTKADIPRHHDPNKPDPSRIRMWTDRTGAFKVEAEFLSCANGKIRLFKTNGVKIDVPTQKMCMEDLLYIQSETGQNLIQNDDIPLGQLKVGFTWIDYFKRARLPHYACVQYAKSFEKSGLVEHDVERLTHRRMKSLGMSERHVQRIQRFIETNRAEPPSEDENEQPKKVKKSVTFGAVSYIVEHDDEEEEEEGSVQWQIEQDEKLARQLQEQDQHDQHTSGLHRRGTGRPTPAQSAPRGVNSAVLTPQQFKQEPLKPTPPPPQQQPLQPIKNVIPAPPKFEDDAWAPRSSPLISSSSAPSWSQSAVQAPGSQAASRQRPTPPVSQQSLVDPQLLAKWGGSPSLAAANSRPVPPPPALASSPLHQSLNSLPAQQKPMYQQPSNNSFVSLQSNNSFVTSQSTSSLTPAPPANNFAPPQQQLSIGNSFQQPNSTGSFTTQQAPTSFSTGNNYQQQLNTGNSFHQQASGLQQQASGLQHQAPAGLQHQATGLQQANVNSYQLPNNSGSYSSLPQTSFQHQTPTNNGSFSSLQTGNSFQQPTNFQQGYAPFNPSPSLQPTYLGVQPQASGANWATATPANPFGGASPSPSYQQLPPQNTVSQYNNNIDPNDKYSVFKTVDTTTPSVFNKQQNFY